MGNDIKKIGGKIGHMIQQQDTPQTCTQQGVPLNKQQNMADTEKLNILLSKNIINLGAKLQLQANSLSRNGPKWDNSLVRGKITVEVQGKLQNNVDLSVSTFKQNNNGKLKQEFQGDQSAKLQNNQHINNQQPFLQKKQNLEHSNHSSSPQKNNLQNSTHKKIRSYTIILTLSQLYQIKNLLQSYSHQQTQLSQKRKSYEGKICVICLDKKPQQVLPCAHAYCKDCMNLYVVSKDRICPMCRKSYRQSLAENIYQIVEWDEEFVTQMRTIFYSIIQHNNPKQVKKIKKLISLTDHSK